jgi:hypothetical protein
VNPCGACGHPEDAHQTKAIARYADRTDILMTICRGDRPSLCHCTGFTPREEPTMETTVNDRIFFTSRTVEFDWEDSTGPEVTINRAGAKGHIVHASVLYRWSNRIPEWHVSEVRASSRQVLKSGELSDTTRNFYLGWDDKTWPAWFIALVNEHMPTTTIEVLEKPAA